MRRSCIGASCALLMWAFAVSPEAHAQDPESGDLGASAGGSASASASTSSSLRMRSSGSGTSGGGGLKLEFQGRFNALTIAGVESLTLEGSERGVTLPAVPFVTPGIRLLDGDLFLGLGLGFGRTKTTTETPGGEVERKRNAFMLVPTATYDFLGDDAVALYGLGMLQLGKVGGGEDDPGNDVDGAFWWGLNLGVGLRGAIGEHVWASTEFGWGFARGTWEEPNGNDETRFGTGFFGVIGFAVDIDL